MRYEDSEDFSCFSSTSTHRRKFYKQHPTFLREDKLPTYFRSLHTFAAISSTNDTQRRVESCYFFLDLQVLQWLLVQEDVETEHKSEISFELHFSLTIYRDKQNVTQSVVPT